jgi:hypothetical protein
MNSAFGEGRLHVHRSCVRLQRTARHWTGEDDDLKHAFDGAGYGLDVYMGDEIRAGTPRRMVMA